MNIEDISTELKALSPAKRVKFLRQKILQQNQTTFCADGIVRSGTLKSIESERMKIGPKVADRLVRKLSLEGIKCQADLFLTDNSRCILEVDFSKRKLAGESISYLEEMRQRIGYLTPIFINSGEFEPLIPQGTTLLTYEAGEKDLQMLNNRLCYIKGDKSQLYYVKSISKDKFEAFFNNKKVEFLRSMLDICSVYIVEIIYFGGQ